MRPISTTTPAASLIPQSFPAAASRLETCIRRQLFPGKLVSMAKHRGERQLDGLQFRAWRAFLYAYSRVVRRLDQELAGAHGLSLNQYEVLLWLGRAGERGLRMSD